MAGMDTRRRVGIGALVAGLLLLVAGWWLWGGVETPEVEAPRRGVGRVAMRPTEPPPYLRRDNEGPPQLEDVLDEGVAKATDPCRYIMEWQLRNVHDFVILDNLDARSQRFTEDDVACLTAAGARNAILEYAERNIKVPQPPR